MKNNQIIENFYAAFSKGNFSTLPISPKVKHTSPFGVLTGKAAFLETCAKPEFVNPVRIVKQIIDGDEACVQIEITTPWGLMKSCEWLTIRDGLIDEIVVYFDRQKDL